MAKKAGRIVVTVVAVIFLIWFTAPVYWGIINPGNMLGVLICLYLIFWCGFNNTYKKLKNNLCIHKFIKILWKVFNVCAAVFVAYAVIISGLMIYCSSAKPPENSTAVVLGAQVKPYGPSVLLQQRIDAAEKYLNENPKAASVVTGGKGNDEIMSEAQCMYDNITKDGIDSKRIFMEDKAENTLQNIKFSYKIVKENNLNENLAIVTDNYHQLRARIIAYKQNINTEIGAINTTNNFIGIVSYPTYFVREWIAIPLEFLK